MEYRVSQNIKIHSCTHRITFAVSLFGDCMDQLHNPRLEYASSKFDDNGVNQLG